MNRKSWVSLIIIGLSGQIAWTIENMYFNVFMYNMISTDPGYIAAMVSSSAVVATLTTLFIGALSDRTGRRKIFISLGYMVWALSVFAFAFIKKEYFRSTSEAAGCVIAADCIMTFFGSSANDAAFNAYVTETVKKDERTKVESVLQILPMAALLLVFGVLDSFTQKGEWPLFFSITALVMFTSGIISIPLLDNDRKKGKDETKPEKRRVIAIRENSALYTALTAYMLNSLSLQIFFPYLIIYMQEYLGFKSQYVILLALTLVVSSVTCVAAGKLTGKWKRTENAFLSVIIFSLGLVLMYYARSFVFTTISGIVMMSGYLISSSILSGIVRDSTPKGREGETQGIRMIFLVMLPMVIGPYIGALAIRGSDISYTELGVTKTLPSPLIFLLAAVVEILTLVPVMILKKKETKI